MREFQKEFGEKFLLMTRDEVIEKKLMGTGKEHEIFRSMQGNYLAIATDDLSVYLVLVNNCVGHCVLTVSAYRV